MKSKFKPSFSIVSICTFAFVLVLCGFCSISVDAKEQTDFEKKLVQRKMLDRRLKRMGFKRKRSPGLELDVPYTFRDIQSPYDTGYPAPVQQDPVRLLQEVQHYSDSQLLPRGALLSGGTNGVPPSLVDEVNNLGVVSSDGTQLTNPLATFLYNNRPDQFKFGTGYNNDLANLLAKGRAKAAEYPGQTVQVYSPQPHVPKNYGAGTVAYSIHYEDPAGRAHSISKTFISPPKKLPKELTNLDDPFEDIFKSFANPLSSSSNYDNSNSISTSPTTIKAQHNLNNLIATIQKQKTTGGQTYNQKPYHVEPVYVEEEIYEEVPVQQPESYNYNSADDGAVVEKEDPFLAALLNKPVKPAQKYTQKPKKPYVEQPKKVNYEATDPVYKPEPAYKPQVVESKYSADAFSSDPFLLALFNKPAPSDANSYTTSSTYNVPIVKETYPYEPETYQGNPNPTYAEEEEYTENPYQEQYPKEYPYQSEPYDPQSEIFEESYTENPYLGERDSYPKYPPPVAYTEDPYEADPYQENTYGSDPYVDKQEYTERPYSNPYENVYPPDSYAEKQEYTETPYSNPYDLNEYKEPVNTENPYETVEYPPSNTDVVYDDLNEGTEEPYEPYQPAQPSTYTDPNGSSTNGQGYSEDEEEPTQYSPPSDTYLKEVVEEETETYTEAPNSHVFTGSLSSYPTNTLISTTTHQNTNVKTPPYYPTSSGSSSSGALNQQTKPIYLSALHKALVLQQMLRKENNKQGQGKNPYKNRNHPFLAARAGAPVATNPVEIPVKQSTAPQQPSPYDFVVANSHGIVKEPVYLNPGPPPGYGTVYNPLPSIPYQQYQVPYAPQSYYVPTARAPVVVDPVQNYQLGYGPGFNLGRDVRNTQHFRVRDGAKFHEFGHIPNYNHIKNQNPPFGASNISHKPVIRDTELDAAIASFLNHTNKSYRVRRSYQPNTEFADSNNMTPAAEARGHGGGHGSHGSHVGHGVHESHAEHEDHDDHKGQEEHEGQEPHQHFGVHETGGGSHAPQQKKERIKFIVHNRHKVWDKTRLNPILHDGGFDISYADIHFVDSLPDIFSGLAIAQPTITTTKPPAITTTQRPITSRASETNEVFFNRDDQNGIRSESGNPITTTIQPKQELVLVNGPESHKGETPASFIYYKAPQRQQGTFSGWDSYIF